MSTTQLSYLGPQTAFSAENDGVRTDFQKPAKPDTFKDLVIDAARTSDAFRSIIPTAQEEGRIAKTRRVMGDDVKDLSDEQLEVFLTEFNFLLDCWLDQYEQEVFDGKTLQQILREG